MARFRAEKEELEKYSGLLRLLQVLSCLVVFVAGIIIGLTTSSHMKYYFTTQSLIFSDSRYSLKENCTIVKSCSEDECLKIERFIRPINLTHTMTDSELYWRASMVPFREEYPYDRTPKVAFMFLTRGPLPMLPLWERFFKGHEQYFSIYIHAQPGFRLNVSEKSPFFRREIPSEVCS